MHRKRDGTSVQVTAVLVIGVLQLQAKWLAIKGSMTIQVSRDFPYYCRIQELHPPPFCMCMLAIRVILQCLVNKRTCLLSAYF